MQEQRRRTIWLRALAGATCLLAGAVGLATDVTAADPSPAFIPPTADWLTTVNYYRSIAGLGPVVGDANLSDGAAKHSCYMLYNGISHDETPGLLGYTPEGDAAGNNGNVAVSSVFGQSDRSHIELWMTGPFHAIGVLRPNLRTVGYGKCDLRDTPTWHSGATLDVLHGLSGNGATSEPILFPGNGTTTNLSRFIVETPNPLEFCGWTGTAGLPIIALLPENPGTATGTVTGPGGAQQTCVLTSANTTGVAQQILAGNNAVVVIPRNPLDAGSVQVAVQTAGRSLRWGFTVDPAAATGISPVPNASAIGGQTALQPIAPVRVVDTREDRGTSRLASGTDRRIQITGLHGIPAGATAVVANVTAARGAGAGFVTLWNCSTQPVASTMNFQPGEVVPNSATIPLDNSGGLCAYSNTDTDLIIDVTGYYLPSGGGRYAPLVPTRLMDTRVPLGPSARLVAGQTVELKVTGTAGVPTNATAVAINVTSDNASAEGFVTVYPCGERPIASNLNPLPGRTRANLVISAVSTSGTVCVYSSQPTELIVDVDGYLAPTGATTFGASSPFRFTDTRDRYRTEMNAGTAGNRMGAGHVVEIPIAGRRGIPANAKAVSANITVVDAAGPGFITVWPCGPIPSVSNINYDAANPVANAAQLPLSTGGSVCAMSYTDAQLIIDVNGWWS